MRKSMLLGAILSLSILGVACQAQEPSDRGLRVGSPPTSVGQPYRKVHVLLVGVNDYQSPGVPDLLFAINDVTQVERTLVERYGVMPGAVKKLIGPDATLANINDALAELSNSEVVQHADAVFVYFSLHGNSLRTPSGTSVGYLIPQDAKLSLSDRNPALYNKYALSMQSVWDKLEPSPARHILVVADACFSGLLVNPRGNPEPKDPISYFPLNFGRIGREALVAADSEQKSKEDSSLKHGRFTHAFLRELENRALTGHAFDSADLFAVLKRSASFGQDQQPVHGSRDGSAGLFTFMPGGTFRDPGASTRPADALVSDPNREPASRRVRPTLLSYAEAEKAFLSGQFDIAEPAIRTAAASGMPRAKALLGRIHDSRGEHTESFKLYAEAAPKDPVAKYCYGRALSNGIGCKQNKEQGLGVWNRGRNEVISLAENGSDTLAMLFAAETQWTWSPKDYADGERFYRLAAKSGSPVALEGLKRMFDDAKRTADSASIDATLGRIYEGLTDNPLFASVVIRRAAAGVSGAPRNERLQAELEAQVLQSPDLSYEVARILWVNPPSNWLEFLDQWVEGDVYITDLYSHRPVTRYRQMPSPGQFPDWNKEPADKRAFDFLFNAVNKQHVEAAYRAAGLYEKGLHGIAKDEVKALSLFEFASGRGHENANYRMAHIYQYGELGMTKNWVKSLDCWRKTTIPHWGLVLLLQGGYGLEKSAEAAFEYAKNIIMSKDSSSYDRLLTARQFESYGKGLASLEQVIAIWELAKAHGCAEADAELARLKPKLGSW